MLSATSQQFLIDAIARGAVVITANRRLQRALTSSIANQRWQTAPAISAADDWVHEQWLELQDRGVPGSERILLTPFQCRKLWHQIVEADPPALALIGPSQLAQQTESAARLVEEWDIPVDGSDFEQREEYVCFLRWYRRYQALLTQRGLTTASQCRTWVRQAFEAELLPKLPQILLYGFDDLSPQLTSLFDVAAVNVEHWRPLPDSSNQSRRTKAADAETEIRAAALWSRSLIEASAATSPEPREAPRIGIIVPRLSSLRPVVERIFTEVFETATWLPSEPRLTLPFNFSAGVSLSSVPLVADALTLLSFNLRFLTPDDWRRLLLSPFWGRGLDNGRRELLLRLNRSSKMQLTTGELRRLAEKAQQQYDSDESWPIADALADFTELARRQPRQQSYNAWADVFAEQLQICRWPGARVLDSPEYQQQQHVYQLLEQLGQCDACLPSPVTQAQALQCLRELADSTTFQAQTQTSPVQILGLLEGAGLHFDHCWVMDLSDLSWPPAAKPNPFIPLVVQTRLGLPRSNAERELVYARALTQRLQESTQDLIFSWPESEGEVSLQPSQLIRDVEHVGVEHIVGLHQRDRDLPGTDLENYADAIAQSAEFEWIDCAKAPPWTDLSQPLPGGTGAIKLQSICPFNAFAVYRLGARPRETLTIGLNAAERGTMVHGLMASLWESLGDHQTLVQMDHQALAEMVRNHVESTLAFWRMKRSDVLHPRFFALEQQRLETLALKWLALEAERPPFRVAATEMPQTLCIATPGGDAQLTGRIDRIDQLPSGKKLIIDYKTGNASIQQWQGERPTDLQLPLYALAQADEVAAITFAELNVKRAAFAGVGQLSAEDGAIDGIVPAGSAKSLPDDWQQTLDQWRSSASQLLQEFLQGDCSTTVYNKNQAQYYRYLEPLNRR